MEVIQKLADEWDDEEDGMEETLNEGIPKLNQVRNTGREGGDIGLFFTLVPKVL